MSRSPHIQYVRWAMLGLGAALGGGMMGMAEIDSKPELKPEPESPLPFGLLEKLLIQAAGRVGSRGVVFGSSRYVGTIQSDLDFYLGPLKAGEEQYHAAGFFVELNKILSEYGSFEAIPRKPGHSHPLLVVHEKGQERKLLDFHVVHFSDLSLENRILQFSRVLEKLPEAQILIPTLKIPSKHLLMKEYYIGNDESLYQLMRRDYLSLRNSDEHDLFARRWKSRDQELVMRLKRNDDELLDLIKKRLRQPAAAVVGDLPLRARTSPFTIKGGSDYEPAEPVTAAENRIGEILNLLQQIEEDQDLFWSAPEKTLVERLLTPAGKNEVLLEALGAKPLTAQYLRDILQKLQAFIANQNLLLNSDLPLKVALDLFWMSADLRSELSMLQIKTVEEAWTQRDDILSKLRNSLSQRFTSQVLVHIQKRLQNPIVETQKKIPLSWAAFQDIRPLSLPTVLEEEAGIKRVPRSNRLFTVLAKSGKIPNDVAYLTPDGRLLDEDRATLSLKSDNKLLYTFKGQWKSSVESRRYADVELAGEFAALKEWIDEFISTILQSQTARLPDILKRLEENLVITLFSLSIGDLSYGAAVLELTRGGLNPQSLVSFRSSLKFYETRSVWEGLEESIKEELTPTVHFFSENLAAGGKRDLLMKAAQEILASEVLGYEVHISKARAIQEMERVLAWAKVKVPGRKKLLETYQALRRAS